MENNYVEILETFLMVACISFFITIVMLFYTSDKYSILKRKYKKKDEDNKELLEMVKVRGLRIEELVNIKQNKYLASLILDDEKLKECINVSTNYQVVLTQKEIDNYDFVTRKKIAENRIFTTFANELIKNKEVKNVK